MREQVLEATIALIVENGYEGLRFEDVARDSGVHKTTIYRRWPSRTDLVRDAITEYTMQAVPMPDTGSVREDFIRILVSLAKLLQSDAGRAVLRTAQSSREDARDVAELGREIWRSRVAAAENVVRRAIERGELPATDAEVLFEQLCGPVHFRITLGGRRFTRGDAERQVDLVLAGARALGAKSASSKADHSQMCEPSVER
ncbi:TetR/AcrR family transcriptional regulator [Nocardia sp. NPDC001965]